MTTNVVNDDGQFLFILFIALPNQLASISGPMFQQDGFIAHTDRVSF